MNTLADPRQVPWPGTIVGDRGLAVNPSALAARFRERRKEILTEGSPAAARWAAFSGGAWDAAATARALDEAVLALGGAATTSLPTRLRKHRDVCCAACPRRRCDGGPR